MSIPEVQEKLGTIPAHAGVYLMKGEAGEILYVGKAVNLRSRIRSYFQASADHSLKVHRLVQDVVDLDFIVTASELEALILECNLIKRHRPPYNVRFKDDKRYPYVRITWQEDFPRVQVVRRPRDDGARYFGPYASTAAMRQTLDLLRRIFPYLTCKRNITGTDSRACLYYHIKRCLGPCVGAVSKEEYRSMMRQVCLFLEGKGDTIVKSLKYRMESAAERLEFERAASLRNQIQAVERVISHQRAVSPDKADQDVIALARDNGETCAQIFFVRAGKLVDRQSFLMDGTDGVETPEVLSAFVKQFYSNTAYIPPEVLLASEMDEIDVIQHWLADRRGAKVALRFPRRGRKRELIQMALENAQQTLTHLMAREQLEEDKALAALGELQTSLGMDALPLRIEAYDISNIQGAAATGSMVVFAQGLPEKSEYRKFKIRRQETPDDYAMMQEVLRRRFRKAATTDSVADEAWATLPDLIVIDGGKGQLNVAVDVLAEYGLEEVSAVGLAKAQETIFRPGRSEPLTLPADSPGLQLLQHLRDEAHRFAVTYHRHLRRRRGLSSVLEEIPGIGPKRRRALLKRFGSVEAIRRASLDELATVKGMNKTVARKIQESL